MSDIELTNTSTTNSPLSSIQDIDEQSLSNDYNESPRVSDIGTDLGSDLGTDLGTGLGTGFAFVGVNTIIGDLVTVFFTGIKKFVFPIII